MHKKFDNQSIEKKWQEIWKESGIYNVGERDLSKQKEYILIELPYPSGNLHIGHWHAFSVPDIYVRFQRMNGIQVIFPIGFDAFGLPAENAAIKRNLNPKEWTEGNIEFMKTQLASMGASFSWDKTASTTDADYYKWTQWMFTEFFKKDIAYRGKGTVNWCPGCNTVIANEQVLADGTCERSGDVIEKKEMPQWMLRITKYADRLIDDLDGLHWPEQIKDAQRNWIGRSKGAEITFKLSTGDEVTVFTTRPDTLYGATYLVLAPEHPLLKTIIEQTTNKDNIARYIELSAQKDEQDRLDVTKEKTGVKVEGITAVNPASGEEIPVFIADYILGGYGTGAIMAVPAHDQRDFDFADKYSITKKAVISPLEFIEKRNASQNEIEKQGYDLLIQKFLNAESVYIGIGPLINSAEFDGLDSESAQEKIVAKVGGKMTNTYRLRDWSVGRQRYWGVPIPIVYDPKGVAHPIPKEHLPWLLPEDVDFTPTGVPPLSKSEELKKRTVDIFGEGWTPEVETMDTFVDSSWYFLRYLDNQNQDEFTSLQIQKDWMPIDIYFGGAEHTTMHLLYSRFWQKVLLDFGLVTENEPYKRRINRGLILGPDGNKMSKSKGNVIDPDEHVKTVGADTVKMYLAFMGPYADTANYPWDMGGIAGIRRFLERVYGLREHIVENEPLNSVRQLHKTIAKVQSDVPLFKFNTAISAMMVYLNTVEKEGLSQSSYETFLKLLAPFASHLSEELWSELKKETSIHLEDFPTADATLCVDSEVTISVQIDGKMRGTIVVEMDASEDEVCAVVLENETLQKYFTRAVQKRIFVQNRIINFILESSLG